MVVIGELKLSFIHYWDGEKEGEFAV
nr:MetaGeneMark_Unknown Function [uncultured bacterium]